MWPFLVEQLKNPNYDIDRPIDPIKWNWSDLGASKHDVGKVWERIVNTENFFYNLKPLPGLRELKYFLDRGFLGNHHIGFLTSRPNTAGWNIEEQCWNWLVKHLRITDPVVHVVHSASHKNNVLNLYEVDHFLDDYAPTCIFAKYFCPGTKMLRQSWNRAEEYAYSIPSVDNVEEFLDGIVGV